jgi:hypothetical protein
MPANSTKTQRDLTIDFITKKRLNLPTVWLKPEASAPKPEDALKKPESLSTDIEEWRDLGDDRNLGVRLVDGHIELRIVSPDDIWPMTFFEACSALRIDTRAAFGTRRVSSVILQVDPDKIESWRGRWPKGHRTKGGEWVETSFETSLTPTKLSKAIWRDSRPLPGSRVNGELVVWRPQGKPATDDIDLGLENLERRMLGSTSMEAIIRAIAFSTLGYWIRVYLEGLQEWDESLTRTIGGWIARLVREGKDINARGKSLEHLCWSPIEDGATAAQLIAYLGKLGAGKDLQVAFEHAESALERNSQATVPGWGAIETRFGVQAKLGIRRAFRAGLDIDLIEYFSDRYVFDIGEHVYVDRERLIKGLSFQQPFDVLTHQWADAKIIIGTKTHNPFTLYATSSLRTKVDRQEFRPGYPSGCIMRASRASGILNGEDRRSDEYQIVNTFPGFPHQPVAVIDPAIMRPAVTMLDRTLGLLTRDNDAQMLHCKKFVAHIVQMPHVKPQVCLAFYGGQGIGKSMFAGHMMTQLFGSLASSARASEIDDKFFIAPYIDKIIVFIDEVRLESVSAINSIKKLVREEYVSGERKYSDPQQYYVPARTILASNTVEIGLKAEDAADRCNYHIMGPTSDNMNMTEDEFLAWSYGQKPFYDEFVEALKSIPFRQHLLRYFADLKVTREELEDLTTSSRTDPNIVQAMMTKSREVARAIVADARVLQGQDITAWFTSAQLRDAIKRADGGRTKVEAPQVLMEFRRAGVLETMRGDMHKFKWGYGRIVEKMGKAHNLPITPNWDFRPGDFDENDVQSQSGAPEWRGNKQRGTQRQERPFDPREDREDPDYMEPE